MQELYYVKSSKVNAKVSDIVVEGNHIEIGRVTYQMLSRKPRGRALRRKLTSLDNATRILLY